jgi:hypothetical protein
VKEQLESKHEDPACECTQNFCEHGSKMCGRPLDENARAQLMMERKVKKDAVGICQACWEKGNEYGRQGITPSRGNLPSRVK